MFKKIVLLLLIVANGYTLYLTWSDKRAAIAYSGQENAGSYRVSEVKLVAISAFGAAPGTLLGFEVFNHKTGAAKTYLREAVKLVLIQNLLLYGVLFIPPGRRRNRGKR